MSELAAAVARAFTAACRDELNAPKPGNVHVFAPGRKSVAMFLAAAAAAAPALSRHRATVGERIEGAVDAALARVNTNTNLGIILLCAPLAAAAEASSTNLRAGLHRVLHLLDQDDAERAFRAIAKARPGGLGEVPEHDVNARPRVSLREAMAAAAGRDRIARQYVTDFADVFLIGAPKLVAARRRRLVEPALTTVAVFLAFLARFEDSHIVREHGPAVAERVRRQAAGLLAQLSRRREPARLLPSLLAFDGALKRAAVNPGTSADLTVATLFADRLTRLAVRPQQ